MEPSKGEQLCKSGDEVTSKVDVLVDAYPDRVLRKYGTLSATIISYSGRRAGSAIASGNLVNSMAMWLTALWPLSTWPGSPAPTQHAQCRIKKNNFKFKIPQACLPSNVRA